MEQIFENGIIPNNIIGLINNGEITEKALKDFAKSIRDESLYVAKEIKDAQVLAEQETINQLDTTKDIAMLAGDIVYNEVIVKANNSAITDELTKKYSNDNNNDTYKNEVYKNTYGTKGFSGEHQGLTNEDFKTRFERDIEDTLLTKDKSAFKEEYKQYFSIEEQERVLGIKDGKDMFDYTLDSGVTDKQIRLDNDIMSTLINTNEPGFNQFKIIDKEGNSLYANRYSSTVLSFLDKYCKNSLLDQSRSGIATGYVSLDLFTAQKKILKAHHSKSLKNLCMKGLGLDEIRKANKEMLQSIAPVKQSLRIAKTTLKTTEAATKLTFNATKKVVGKTLGKEAVKKLDKVGNVASKVRHPLKTTKNYVVRKSSEKIANSKLYSGIKEHLNGVKDRLGRMLSGIRERRSAKIAEGTYKTTRDVIKMIASPFSRIIAEIVQMMRRMITIGVPAIIILIVICYFLSASMMQSVNLMASPVMMPLGNKDDFEAWQKKYNDLDDKFLGQLEYATNYYAEGANLRGDKIVYGVNGLNNEEGMENEDFNNGLYYRYITDKDHDGRTSNIEDVISIMAIMFSQEQSSYKEASLKCIEWLYNISHTFSVKETPLYACDSACHNISYYCTDIYTDYIDEDIKYNPFHAGKLSGGDYEIVKPIGECEVCKGYVNGRYSEHCDACGSGGDFTYKDYCGCISTHLCHHGTEHEASGSSYYLGSSRPSSDICTNAIRDTYTTEHKSSDGNWHTTTHVYYYCGGHSHYVCNGHNYKCCMGHRNIQMNIFIKFAEDIKDMINNIDFGNGDRLAEVKKQYVDYENHIKMVPYIRKVEIEE